MKRSFLVATAIVVLTTMAQPIFAQPATLRYRWVKGDVLKYRMTLQTDSTMSGMPGAGNATLGQTMTQRITLAVEDVAPDGTGTLMETVTAIKAEMNSPMGRMMYDSASPTQNTTDPMSVNIGKMLSPLVGEPVIVVIGVDGSVRKVEGASRLMDKIAAGLGQDPAVAPFLQSIKSTFSDEGLRAMTEQTFVSLAPTPVKPGDRWTGRISIGNPAIGRIAYAMTFTLKSFDETASRATIGVSTIMTQESAPPPGPMNMTVKLGASTGSGEVVLANGLIERSTMRLNMPMTASMSGPDGAPTTITNESKTTMTLERIDK
ncbi:MAG TPA: DUF6263 family protein [Vicinamibacterales bacterium]|nr:DUF6263 family protein [Vicinamibacterales bacterium]